MTIASANGPSMDETATNTRHHSGTSGSTLQGSSRRVESSSVGARRTPNSSPSGIHGLLQMLKDVSDDREDCRQFGSVKRFCHNQECTNFGILQQVRPKARHVCKYMGKGCGKVLYRQAPCLQWQRVVDNDASKGLQEDGMLDAAPAWRKQAPLPAPSPSSSYASGRKSVLYVGSQEALGTSHTDSFDFAYNLSRDSLDCNVDVVLSRQTSAGSVIKEASKNPRTHLEAPGFTFSRASRDCFVRKMPAGNQNLERPQSAASMQEIGRAIGRKESKPMARPRSAHPRGRPQSAMANIEKAGLLRGEWGSAETNAHSQQQDSEECQRPNTAYGYEERWIGHHRNKIEAAVGGKEWGSEETRTAIQMQQNSSELQRSNMCSSVTKAGQETQKAFGCDQSRPGNRGSSRMGTFQGSLAKSHGNHPGQPSKPRVVNGFLVPARIGLGPSDKGAGQCSRVVRPASPPKRQKILEDIFEQKSRDEKEMEMEADNLHEHEEEKSKEERARDSIVMKHTLNGRELRSDSLDKMISLTGRTRSSPDNKHDDLAGKQRWGRHANAVRRMDIMYAVSSFERNPTTIPRPSSACTFLRPKSAMTVTQRPGLGLDSPLSPRATYASDVLSLSNDEDEVGDSSRNEVRVRDKKHKWSDKKMKEDLKLTTASRRPQTAQAMQRNKGTKFELHMSRCDLSVTPKEWSVSRPRPQTAPPSQSTAVDGFRGSVQKSEIHRGVNPKTSIRSPDSIKINDSNMQTKHLLNTLSAPEREEVLTSKSDAAQVILKGSRMDPVSRAASDERALVNAKLAETLNINLSKSKESLLGGFEYRLSASSQSLDEDGLAENSSLSNEGDNGSRIDQPPDFPTSSAVDVQKNLMLSVQLLRQQSAEIKEARPESPVLASNLVSLQSSFSTKSEGTWDMLQLDQSRPKSPTDQSDETEKTREEHKTVALLKGATGETQTGIDPVESEVSRPALEPQNSLGAEKVRITPESSDNFADWRHVHEDGNMEGLRRQLQDQHKAKIVQVEADLKHHLDHQAVQLANDMDSAMGHHLPASDVSPRSGAPIGSQKLSESSVEIHINPTLEGGPASVTNFQFLGPDASHPSHFYPEGCLKAQAKVGWETTFASDVLDLNRERQTRQKMGFRYYKEKLEGSIMLARRMAEEGSKAVLVAKGQVSNKIADRHAKPKEMGVDGSLSLNRYWDKVYHSTLKLRIWRIWQELGVTRNNLAAMTARFVANRYTDVPKTFPRPLPGTPLRVSQKPNRR